MIKSGRFGALSVLLMANLEGFLVVGQLLNGVYTVSSLLFWLTHNVNVESNDDGIRVLRDLNRNV